MTVNLNLNHPFIEVYFGGAPTTHSTSHILRAVVRVKLRQAAVEFCQNIFLLCVLYLHMAHPCAIAHIQNVSG